MLGPCLCKPRYYFAGVRVFSYQRYINFIKQIVVKELWCRAAEGKEVGREWANIALPDGSPFAGKGGTDFGEL